MAQNFGPLYSPYGAYELKAKYQRNLFFGTSVTIGLVLLIVVSLWLTGNLNGESVVKINGKKTPREFITRPDPPPTVIRTPLRNIITEPNTTFPNLVIPTPVPDEEIPEEDAVIEPNSEFAQTGPPGPTHSNGNTNVEINGIIDDNGEGNESAWKKFIRVEIQPVMVHEVTPNFPRIAKRAGLTGKVWIAVLVDIDGTVSDATVANSSGVAALDEAALSVAKQNRFKPAIQNGRPVAVWVTYAVDFVLN